MSRNGEEKIISKLQNITLVKKKLLKKKRKHSAVEVRKLVTMLENGENFVKYIYSRTDLPQIGFFLPYR